MDANIFSCKKTVERDTGILTRSGKCHWMTLCMINTLKMLLTTRLATLSMLVRLLNRLLKTLKYLLILSPSINGRNTIQAIILTYGRVKNPLCGIFHKEKHSFISFVGRKLIPATVKQIPISQRGLISIKNNYG